MNSFAPPPADAPARMSTGKKVLITVGILVVVGLIVGVSIKKSQKKGSPVQMAAVKTEDVVSRVTATGKIEAKRKVDLSANVMGQIVNLAVKEGDVVKKGQFLLQIDRAQLKAQASGSEAALAALFADRDAAKASAAQSDYDVERGEKNFRERIIPEAEVQRLRSARAAAHAQVDSIEKRIEQAKANLTASRDTLSKTTMQAPISGIVTALPVEEGEIAVIGTMNNAGTKLMTISDMGEVEADMRIDETDMPRVRLGQTATLSVDAYPNKTFEGVISEIGSSPISGNSLTGSTSGAVEFSVKIALKNPPADIRPGFSVSADIETGRRTNVVAIPVQALVVQDLAKKVASQEKKDGDVLSTEMKKGPEGPSARRDVEGVYRVDGDKAKFVAVKTGLQGELNVEILEGLKPGEKIITGPFRILRTLNDGDLIREEDQKKKDGKKPEEKG